CAGARSAPARGRCPPLDAANRTFAARPMALCYARPAAPAGRRGGQRRFATIAQGGARLPPAQKLATMNMLASGLPLERVGVLAELDALALQEVAAVM